MLTIWKITSAKNLNFSNGRTLDRFEDIWFNNCEYTHTQRSEYCAYMQMRCLHIYTCAKTDFVCFAKSTRWNWTEFYKENKVIRLQRILNRLNVVIDASLVFLCEAFYKAFKCESHTAILEFKQGLVLSCLWI